MKFRIFSKYEIVIPILGILYAVFLIIKNPQPFGKIALLAFVVFGLTILIRHKVARIAIQGITIIAALLFSVLGTRSLLSNNKNETFFEKNTEVMFSKVSFPESLKKAKEEDKLVFVDFYTVWCGPCIKFQNDVLDDKTAASYMNKAFINTKYDLYKDEGITLKDKYNVYYVPRFLILDANGTIVEDISTDETLTKERMISISKKYTNFKN